MKLAAGLVATLILSGVFAAPAEAATAKKKKAAQHTTAQTVQGKPASADPTAVYVSGEYVGRDPDPGIRAYMMRNPHPWDGPN